MGAIYKKTFTKPLPSGAEITERDGQRLARWKPEGERARMAAVTESADGSPRILVRAATYTAKFRDGRGRVVEHATGCRDESAARSVLAELERRAELVRAGVVSATQDAVADEQRRPLSQHIDAYVAHLKAKGVTAGHLESSKRRLRQVCEECGFAFLSDLRGETLEQWLLAHAEKGTSAAVRNRFREACVGFGNWCVRARRLLENPLRLVPKADQKSDPRRKRRALSEAELLRLLDAARRRPIVERGTVTRGERKGAPGAKLAERTRKRLELLGLERALIYKTLALTGLRRAELASLTIAQLDLDGPRPSAALNAKDEKNRQGAQIPLRRDLVNDLRQWLRVRLEALRAEAESRGAPIPAAISPQTPLFTVPGALVKIFDRDIELAGIPKRDDRGRTVDVHSLRTTFATLLSRGGVPLRTAQAAMRHSDPSLTANVYTDPQLLDVAGALDSLPALPLDGRGEAERARATGTLGPATTWEPLAPTLAPTGGICSQNGAFPGNRDRLEGEATSHEAREGKDHASSSAVEACRTLTTRGAGGKTGRGDWIRTSDLMVPNHAF